MTPSAGGGGPRQLLLRCGKQVRIIGTTQSTDKGLDRQRVYRALCQLALMTDQSELVPLIVGGECPKYLLIIDGVCREEVDQMGGKRNRRRVQFKLGSHHSVVAYNHSKSSILDKLSNHCISCRYTVLFYHHPDTSLALYGLKLLAIRPEFNL